jgi:hypothetical protein
MKAWFRNRLGQVGAICPGWTPPHGTSSSAKRRPPDIPPAPAAGCMHPGQPASESSTRVAQLFLHKETCRQHQCWPQAPCTLPGVGVGWGCAPRARPPAPGALNSSLESRWVMLMLVCQASYPGQPGRRNHCTGGNFRPQSPPAFPHVGSLAGQWGCMLTSTLCSAAYTRNATSLGGGACAPGRTGKEHALVHSQVKLSAS